MRSFLLLLTTFIALTAFIVGGMLLATPDGSSLQQTDSMLVGTPFKNFSIPGLILFFIVGGFNIASVFTLMHRHKKAFSYSLAAGIVVMLWIIAHVMFTGSIFWLQFIYMGLSIIILLISFQLKGKSLI